MVVPNTATTVVQNAASGRNVGSRKPRAASAHGMSTTITAPKYANRARVSHFSTAT
jgi:hypothetical protein